MNVSITIKLLLKYYIIILILSTLEFPTPITHRRKFGRFRPARRQQISAAGLSPQKHDKPHVPSHTVRLRRPDRCRPIRRLFTDPSEKPKYTSSERRIRSDPTRYNTGRNGIYRTGNRYDEASETVPTLFTRKQRISSRYGRSSDLFRTARLPGPNGQWLRECTAQKKLTATGIVPDFHRIPF